MRISCLLAVAAAWVLGLPGCSPTGISATAYNPGYGPFDRNGDYVEAWADKPAREHWWSRESSPQPTPGPSAPTPVETEAPLLAANSSRSSASQRTVISTRRPQPSSEVVSRPPAQLVRPAEPAPVSRPSQPASRPAVVAASTAPKPAASPPPPKPKPAPKPTVTHSVVKGDTLYSLSRRYGATVSAIQSANGLGGTTIRIGQSLKIPN